VVSARAWLPHQLKVSVTGAVLIGSGAEFVALPPHAAENVATAASTATAPRLKRFIDWALSFPSLGAWMVGWREKSLSEN
jgi:hypothetical protein